MTDAEIRDMHRWDPRTGTCFCKWEPSAERGAEAEHKRHVERMIQGLPR